MDGLFYSLSSCPKRVWGLWSLIGWVQATLKGPVWASFLFKYAPGKIEYIKEKGIYFSLSMPSRHVRSIHSSLAPCFPRRHLKRENVVLRLNLASLRQKAEAILKTCNPFIYGKVYLFHGAETFLRCHFATFYQILPFSS